MKVLFYYIFIFICSVSAAQAQKVSCYHLHNGKFKIIDSAHNSLVIIERIDSAETQYIYKGDTSQYSMKLVFKVNWINDCTYKLYLAENIIHTKKGDKHIPVDKRELTNRIMDANTNSYLVYTDLNDTKGTKFSNVLWRIQ